ncbi:MAG: hypothetical protein KDE68_08850 [Rhodocyclaceae bacterium]|nr:hypothetical protein [Rhodocyclaceae bacterium]
MQTKYMNRREAAEYITLRRGLKYAASTLAKLASTGGGPKFQKFCGRAVYTESYLDEWVDQKLSAPRQSTSASGGR